MTQNVQNQDAGAHVTSFCGSSSFYGGRSSGHSRGGRFANIQCQVWTYCFPMLPSVNGSQN